jgi:hypothetical protein
MAECVDMIGLEPKGLLTACNCLVKLALPLQGKPQVQVTVNKIWTKQDSSPETGHRLVKASEFP